MTFTGAAYTAALSTSSNPTDYYRTDGVRITHNPYSSEMESKYGKPGSTDNDGFDPYADTVGAGIYSGTVKRTVDGGVEIGTQYQNHNPRKGPVYSGGGYTPVSKAIASYRTELKGCVAGDQHKQTCAPTTLETLLRQYPDLANDVSTGGALPLHTCGMSRENQHATQFLIEHGGDIEALDTYGYTPLHRMASNNLAVGAQALLDAGADVEGSTGAGSRGETPMEIAWQSRATDVIRVLQSHTKKHVPVYVTSVRIVSGYEPLVGLYTRRESSVIPQSFAVVCEAQGWNVASTWKQLNGSNAWYQHEENSNHSYLYYNLSDGHWWIDGPDGLGVWIAPSTNEKSPPASAIQWKPVDSTKDVGLPPALLLYRDATL